MSINCQKCDEIITTFVTKYSKLSDTILSAVLSHSLNQTTSVRIQTAVLVLCQRAALLTQLEDWLLSHVDKKWSKKEARPKEVKLFKSESEWNTFLPLLLFYVSTVEEGYLLKFVVFFCRCFYQTRLNLIELKTSVYMSPVCRAGPLRLRQGVPALHGLQNNYLPYKTILLQMKPRANPFRCDLTLGRPVSLAGAETTLDTLN